MKKGKMKPVNVNAFDILGNIAAGGQIAFGAAVQGESAGYAVAVPDLCHNILGIVDWDLVERTVDGFYSTYDLLPIITAGRVRVWVTAVHTTSENVAADEYLEIADLGGTNLLPIGVFQVMDAETGTKVGATRQVGSLARALEDVTLQSAEVIPSAVTIGDTTVTMTAAGLIDTLSVGDYILLEDITDQAMINRVKSIDSTTQITLQIASTVALDGSTDVMHKLEQVEALLL